MLRPPGRNWAGLAPLPGRVCVGPFQPASRLPLAILPQARRQNPAPSKNGGVHFAQSPCETYTAIFAGTHTLPVRYRQSDPVPTCIHLTVVGKDSGLRWRKTANEYLQIDQGTTLDW